MDNLNSQQVYTYGLQPGSYMQWTESSFLLQYVAGRKKKKNSYSAAEEGTGTCTYMVKASIVKLLIDCGADVNMSSQG